MKIEIKQNYLFGKKNHCDLFLFFKKNALPNNYHMFSLKANLVYCLNYRYHLMIYVLDLSYQAVARSNALLKRIIKFNE